MALTAVLVSYSLRPANFAPLAASIPLFLLLTALWHVRAAWFPSSWDSVGPAFSFHADFPDSQSGLITCVVIMALGHGLLYFVLNAYVPKWSDPSSQRRMSTSSLFPTALATIGLWSLNTWYLHATSATGRQWQGDPYVDTMSSLHIFGGLGLLGTIVLRYWFHRGNGSSVSALEMLALNCCLYALLLFVFFPHFGEVL